jgi:hypothetical protein
MKRAFVAALIFAALIAAGPPADPDTLPAGAEGCVVNGQDLSGPTGPLTHKTACTYTATRDGGYVGAGDWTLKVTVGTVTTTYRPANAPEQGCALWQRGAVVTASIADAASFIAAGNPYPSASDGVRPANNC